MSRPQHLAASLLATNASAVLLALALGNSTGAAAAGAAAEAFLGWCRIGG